MLKDQLKEYYKKECLDYWYDGATDKLKHDSYTNDDEYGDGCAGPADKECPICSKKEEI